ncbi:hypothetical protein [Chryseolinea sp. H1M3-3]|uniref:hypothetical protein n=1 Tax=Chryseolinea sp. H1M3-3 TaxID=3034144 RepID=UPI0023EAE0FF|nr:hypothetical protein [Chryseolinea sp. H1M3-3]
MNRKLPNPVIQVRAVVGGAHAQAPRNTNNGGYGALVPTPLLVLWVRPSVGDQRLQATGITDFDSTRAPVNGKIQMEEQTEVALRFEP